MKKETVYIHCDRVRPTFIERLCLRLGWIKATETFEIRPFSTGTTTAQVKLFEAAGIDLMQPQGMPEDYIPVVKEQRRTVTKIIAVAIRNRGAKGCKKIQRFLDANLSDSELAELLHLVQQKIDVYGIAGALFQLKTLGLTTTQKELLQ